MVFFSHGSVERVKISDLESSVNPPAEPVETATAVAAATSNGVHPSSLIWEGEMSIPVGDNSGMDWKFKPRLVRRFRNGGIELFRISGEVPLPLLMAAVFRLDSV